MDSIHGLVSIIHQRFEDGWCFEISAAPGTYPEEDRRAIKIS